jgi:YD repeat-containing protein
MTNQTFVTLLSIIASALLLSCTSANNGDQKQPQTSTEYRQLKLYYENASGENGLTTFDYDDSGNISIAVWELTDGSRNSLNFYDYDETGQLLRKYREFSDSLTSSQTYRYDKNGNLITEYFERSDGRSGVTNYEYDDSGRQVRAVCDGLNGWFHGIINYEYDESGRKINADIIQKGKHTGIIHYSYNENDNLMKEHWDFSGKWSQTFIYEYEKCPDKIPDFYTSSNAFIQDPGKFRVIKETYDFSNKTGGPSQYTYDQNGKLVQKRFTRSDGLTTKTYYLYDCIGNLTKSYRQYSSGLTTVFDYKFNDNRQLTERSFKRTDGAQGTESYTYDEESRLIQADYNNFDSWLTGTITFTHNQNGDISRGYFKAPKDRSAEIIFEYSDNHHLTKIHWDFSFNRTQTYTFIYEKI